jgi:hypothetical protein
LIVPSGCGGGGGSSVATPGPTTGSVAVAFVGVPPPGNFRSALLNISGVRINPAANADPGAQGWVTIPVPSGSGNGNGSNPGDLQIDLLNTQTMATVFNVGSAQPGTYQTVQVLVDPSIPGTIVPACQGGSSNSEGCTNYPLQLIDNGANPILFTLAAPLTVSADATAPLVVQLSVTIISAPSTSGAPYFVAITPSEVNVGTFLAAVTGNVKVTGSSTGFHLSPLTVSAEISGTNNVIETVPVRKAGVYTLELPAAPTGTSYDVFTTGGGDSYGTLQNILVTPGQFLAGSDLAITSITTTTFNGVIADACTSLGIAGAQLQLLAPAQNATTLPTPRPTPPGGFCFTNPNQCVVVASASTDQNGAYPLPGTTKNPTGFAQAPVDQKDLAVRVSASGYSSLLSDAFLKSLHNQVCPEGTSPTVCNFSLTTGYINGTVNLVSDPPPGNSVMVQVFGETSGTNQLVTALTQPLTFVNHQTSQPFKLNVPISGAGPNFDLFAVAIDPFLGGSSPFTGHDIPVLANLTGPTGGCTSGEVNAPAFAPMNCVGHGSVSGTVQNPDLNTTIVAEKDGVQITGTSAGLLSSTIPVNNQYTLCVPPDDYTLQRFEAVPTSSATTSPTPLPVGTPQPVMVPQPASTSSPCPSSCSNSNSGVEPCPGLCNATAANPL